MREIHRHQVERRKRLQRIEALALVGYVPTYRDYVTYHCYEFIRGEDPLSWEEWKDAITDGNVVLGLQPA